jgi:hypothetical protein
LGYFSLKSNWRGFSAFFKGASQELLVSRQSRAKLGISGVNPYCEGLYRLKYVASLGDLGK